MTDDLDTTGNQIEEKALDAKQALKYAEDLSNLYVSLQGSEKRYRALFEYSPISLWEQDLSQIKKHIDELRHTGVRNFRKYFEENPEEVDRWNDLVKILDANQSTLELYEAESKEDFSRGLNQIMGKRGHDIVREELIALAEGNPFETQCVNHTLKGREIHVLIKASIPPGYETTWSRVLISVHDLTERMRAEFLKEMFGRYLSEEVMNTLLDNPDSVKLGGEKRNLTIMMTDLRGFTSLSERLDPEQVIQLLNIYFEIIIDILLKYDATINEIVGDSLLVIFGAPQQMSDRAERAIACAIEMQNAMAEVNNNNRSQGLPEIEMGIGINEAEVIVGNIGSRKRSKYGVVGSGVNIASRIESYSVGGQILISESIRNKSGKILRIDDQMEIRAKGSEAPLTLYDVGGISGEYNLALDRDAIHLIELVREVPVCYSVLGGNKYVGKDVQKGDILRLSPRSAEIRLETELEPMENLKLNLCDVSEDLSQKDFFGKIIKDCSRDKKTHILRFTSVPPEVRAYFQALCWYGASVED